MQKYVLKVLFTTQTGADLEILPIFEISKEEVLRKLKENLEVYDEFTLYNFDWSAKDIEKFGMPEIQTVPEWFGEDKYV